MISQQPNPPFDRSPVDGYACRSAEPGPGQPGEPCRLRVVAEVDAAAGTPVLWPLGECVGIMTGGAIPNDKDCIMDEKKPITPRMWSVLCPVPHHGNYCFAGEDFLPGRCCFLPAPALVRWR